jgi:hypothetical protein
MSTNSSPRMHSLIFAAVLVLAGCGQDLTATEHVEKAKGYMDKGELRPAMIELSSAVQKDPKLGRRPLAARQGRGRHGRGSQVGKGNSPRHGTGPG